MSEESHAMRSMNRNTKHDGPRDLRSRCAADVAVMESTDHRHARVVMEAVVKGQQVGMQGTRPVFELVVDGVKRRIAVTIGSNGYIVGANPSK